MPVERRSRRLFVYLLAVPVLVTVYVAAFGARIWAALRPGVALALGATVVGSVYVEEAWRRTPAPRVSPIRAAAVLALAMVVVGAGLPSAPTRAANVTESVIEAAQSYTGTPYRLGTTGPRTFDCSGLMFRIFADVGELPRICGKRMRAVQYYNWFKARGLIETNPSAGERGDLVYYSNTAHIGIYLGDGRVLSAMATGVKTHGLQTISSRFVAFLKVNWSVGDPIDPPGDVTPAPKPKNDKPKPDKPRQAKPKPDRPAGDDRTSTESSSENAGGPRGLAIGTMNLRRDADPSARIVGWVSRGSMFTIVTPATAPAARCGTRSSCAAARPAGSTRAGHRNSTTSISSRAPIRWAHSGLARRLRAG
jgi:cell wall-associated NlpC family hydrolase